MEWMACKDKAERLLGQEALRKSVLDEVYVPSEKQLTDLIEKCKADGEAILRRNVSERKDMARRLDKWDWENNYGRNAFRCAKDNYVPPTTHLAKPGSPGVYITDSSAIHDCFGESWK